VVHTSVSSDIGNLTPAWGIHLRSKRTRWTRLCLAIAFVLCLTVFARADIVSGRVFGPDGKILTSAASFYVETRNGRVDFSTDGSGNFSVYLDVGTYTVHSTDNTLVGTIHGYSQSAREDIHLRKQ